MFDMGTAGVSCRGGGAWQRVPGLGRPVAEGQQGVCPLIGAPAPAARAQRGRGRQGVAVLGACVALMVNTLRPH